MIGWEAKCLKAMRKRQAEERQTQHLQIEKDIRRLWLSFPFCRNFLHIPVLDHVS